MDRLLLWAACAALSLAAACGLRARDGMAAASGEEALSPVFVGASNGDPWQYFAVPGFEVISHCPDDFNRAYARALERGIRDRLFLASYGLYEVQAGDTARAREALESATRAGVVRPCAYLELARLNLEEALPAAQEGIGDLTDEEYAGVIRLVTVARLQAPSLRASYELLAHAMEHAPRKPSPEELAVLEGGLDRFPRDAALAYRVATLLKRMGHPGEARALAQRAVALAGSDGQRTPLQYFLAQGP